MTYTQSDIVLILLIASVIVSVGVIAARAGGYLGGLLISQTPYLALPFVIRPLILLKYQPLPTVNDPIADTRLARLGYAQGLFPILGLVLFGLTFYAAVIFVLSRKIFRSQGAAPSGAGVTLSSFALLIVIAWVFRIAFLASPSTFANTLGALGVVGAGGIILTAPQTWRKTRLAVVFGSLLASELAWSLLAATKAPFFACCVWILIRAVANNGISVRVIRIALIVGALLIISFPLVQNQKIARGVFQQQQFNAYSPTIRPILPIVARFDLIVATIDAYEAGPHSWIGPRIAAGRALEYLSPVAIGFKKPQDTGRLWALEVRPLSSSNQTVSSVHLAEGPIAEGYVIDGRTGVAFEITILAAAVALAGRLLSSPGRFRFLLGLSIMSAPYLYERGVLGLAAGMEKALQLSVIAWLVILASQAAQKSISREVVDPRQAREMALVHGQSLGPAGAGTNP